MSNNNSIYEYKYFIKGDTERDCSLFGAFADDGKIRFEIKTPTSMKVSEVRMLIHCDGLDCECGERYLEVTLEPVLYSGKETLFSAIISPESLYGLSSRGLYYYKYAVKTSQGEDMYGGEMVTELECGEDAYDRQLLLYDSNFKTPDFMKQGTIYHIFVDRFASSGKCSVKDGAILNPDWENGIPQYAEYRGAPLKNNEFFGGDLWGVAEKLDYIKSLGVNIIYLSPIFDAASNHKYDTGNYMAVDSMFGGDEALEHLCRECDKKGIKLFIDGVFNHTGSDSIYFNKYGNYDSVGAYNSKHSPYYDWYNFYEYPDKYECWWNIEILPRIKTDCEGFREHILGENGVIRKYMEMGVSGVRLDVADELSDSFLKELRKVVKSQNSDGLVLGEVWEDASNKIAYGHRRTYFKGNQLDSVMNYPLRNGVIQFIKYGDNESLAYVLETVYRHYPKCVSDVLMNFLGTHDTERILTVLGDGESDGRTPSELATLRLSETEKEKAVKLLKCAYTIIATVYGTPSVFYGDEAGLEGYHDPFCRRPYPWGSQNKELLAFYSEMGKVRSSEKLFAEGCFRLIKSETDIFIYERFDENERIIVAITRDKPYAFRNEKPFKCILNTNSLGMPEAPACELVLDAYSAYVLKEI